MQVLIRDNKVNLNIQGNVPRFRRISSVGLRHVSIALIFLVASMGTLFIALLGTNPVITFFVGTVIVGLFLFDLLRTNLLMHVYQILLIYFYFSLVVFHTFNDKSDPYYDVAYIISVLHFLFFIVGYHLISTKYAESPIVTPRQNPLTAIYITYGVVAACYMLWTNVNGGNYSAQFLSYEEATSRPIYSLYMMMIFDKVSTLVVYLLSHPVFLFLTTFLIELLYYPISGIKGSVVSYFFVIIVVVQIYIRRFSLGWVLVIGIVGSVSCFFLIGSTSFRGQLGLASLFDAVSNIETVTWRWEYFILQSPESSHIRYITELLNMMDNKLTDFRYGFDYYRFFIYPIKHLFLDFQLSSYNQYPVLESGRKVSAGLYLGLAGELFWNFGWFFPLLSLAYGYSLKWFTNFAFSGSFLGFLLYLMLFKSLIWQFYRGETNAFIMEVSVLVISLIILRTCLQVRQIRTIVDLLSNLVVKRFKGKRVDYD
jgi:hypothetical protein